MSPACLPGSHGTTYVGGVPVAIMDPPPKRKRTPQEVEESKRVSSPYAPDPAPQVAASNVYEDWNAVK